MSQFKQKALQTIALSALLGSILAPVTANAAMTASQGRNVVYKTTFNDLDGAKSAVLDWKNQSVEFSFDMTDADWTDGLELLLSADPLGRVSSRTPIMVQFNNGKPTPIVTRGQGFDTRIKLDKAKIRPRRNKVKFTYITPSGAECLLPQHGGWRLNFDESFVVVKARAKSRIFQLREIEARLANATTAPKSISILARGQNTAKLQALAAQGVGMRVKNLPDFKTTKSNSEFEIVLGRRDELYGWVNKLQNLFAAGLGLTLAISGFVAWWKRRPTGSLGVPPATLSKSIGKGLAILIVVFAIFLPLVGSSLIIVLLLDRFLFKKLDWFQPVNPRAYKT